MAKSRKVVEAREPDEDTDASASVDRVDSADDDGEDIRNPVAEDADDQIPDSDSADDDDLGEDEDVDEPEELPAAEAWRESYRKRGMDIYASLGSEEEARERVLDDTQRVIQQYAERMQWMAQQQGQPQQQPAQPAAETGPRWKPPEYDSRWLNLVQRDADGNIVAIPGADPSLPQKIRAYQDWAQEQQHNFLRDPGSFIEQHIQDRVDNLVQERIQAQITHYHEQQAIERLVQQNLGWLAERDGRGNPQIDPVSGNYRWSPRGMNFLQRVFTNDPNAPASLLARWQNAWNAEVSSLVPQVLAGQQAKAGRVQGQAQPASVPGTPGTGGVDDTDADAKRRFVQGATRRPQKNRRGRGAADEEPRDRHVEDGADPPSIVELARKHANKRGLSLNL